MSVDGGLGNWQARRARHRERRWERVAGEWVTVLARYGDGSAQVQYADGTKLRVSQWALAVEKADAGPETDRNTNTS